MALVSLPQSELVAVAGVKLEVLRLAGQRAGPTLVLLHEGLGCVALWKDFPARLRDATELPVLVYSRRGYGRSDPIELPRPPSFMHDEARETLPALLRTCGVDDLVLVGHSDGGSIALIHAASFPDAPVRGVIAEAAHVFVEDVTLESIRRAAAAYEDSDLRSRLARYHGDNVDGAFHGWSRVWLSPAFRNWDLRPQLAAIRCPVLAIQGDHDPYGTLAQVDAIAHAVAGDFESLVLSHVGHAPHVEQPDVALATMARWTRQLIDQPVL